MFNLAADLQCQRVAILIPIVSEHTVFRIYDQRCVVAQPIMISVNLGLRIRNINGDCYTLALNRSIADKIAKRVLPYESTSRHIVKGARRGHLQ